MLGLIIAIVVFAIPVLSYAQETRLGGEFWGRYTNETAKYKDASGEYVNKMHKNYFALDRGYLDFRTKFSETTSARFTVDIFSTDASHEYEKYKDVYTNAQGSVDTLFSEPTKSSVDGAGLKLKYAYVDFANLIPIPDMILSAGLQKVYFGSIYDWTYNLIGKAMSDEYKVADSADYGVTLNGFIPHGLGEYAFGIYNGEGYKKFGSTLKENMDFSYLGNIRITPIAGITIGGSYMQKTLEREESLKEDKVNYKYQEQTSIDGIARLAYGPVDVWAEYIQKDVVYPNKKADEKLFVDYKASGFSIFPTISLYQFIGYDVQLLGRYDSWEDRDSKEKWEEKNTLPDNPDHGNVYWKKEKYINDYKLNAITYGVNYNFLHDESFVPKMQVQLNYTTKKYDAEDPAEGLKNEYTDGNKDSSTLMLQLKWRFSSTIK